MPQAKRRATATLRVYKPLSRLQSENARLSRGATGVSAAASRATSGIRMDWTATGSDSGMVDSI